MDLEVGPVSRWGKGDPRGSIPPPVERLHSVRTADVLVFRLEIKCRLVQTDSCRLFPSEFVASGLIFWYIEYICWKNGCEFFTLAFRQLRNFLEIFSNHRDGIVRN